MNKFSFDIKKILTENYCRKNFIAPNREEGDLVVFYSLHINDEILKYNLSEKLGRQISLEEAPLEKINVILDDIYKSDKKDYLLEDIDNKYEDLIVLEDEDKEDSPAVRVLDYILRESIEKNASDIHIEPRFDNIIVRIRIDGALNKLIDLPKKIYPYLVTRIKILSQLDISEKRLPQDGRFSFDFKGEKIDIRVATTPTGNGEKIVLRILDIQRISYTPEGIGLVGENYDKVMKLISQPSGLILICGPTSSGKSTLLEAIAIALGLNPEGGSKNFNFATKETHSELGKLLEIARGSRREEDGFFLRAESFYNLATEVEELASSGFTNFYDSYGGKSLHDQSHGESFRSLILNRFRPRGIYLLDEPEAALSPTSQMSLLCIIDELVKKDTQFIIASHSPIILAYPNADIYEFSEVGIEKKSYKETESYSVTKAFLDDPERMMNFLFDD